MFHPNSLYIGNSSLGSNLIFEIDGVARITVPNSLSSAVVITSPLSVTGGSCQCSFSYSLFPSLIIFSRAVMLSPTGQQALLYQSSGDQLLINPSGSYTGGVVFGSNQMILSTSSGFLGVGSRSVHVHSTLSLSLICFLFEYSLTLNPLATIHSAGGVRSAKGSAFGVGNSANLGFAFASDGDTGMFAVGG